MNPDPPILPDEEREARITALLLGELTADEAEATRQAISRDPELAQLKERLRKTIQWVRETAADPIQESQAFSSASHLSPARRDALLRRLRQRDDPSIREISFRREWPWYIPASLAAALVCWLGITAVLLDTGSVKWSRSSTRLAKNEKADSDHSVGYGHWKYQEKIAEVPKADIPPPQSAGQQFGLPSSSTPPTAAAAAADASVDGRASQETPQRRGLATGGGAGMMGGFWGGGQSADIKEQLLLGRKPAASPSRQLAREPQIKPLGESLAEGISVGVNFDKVDVDIAGKKLVPELAQAALPPVQLTVEPPPITAAGALVLPTDQPHSIEKPEASRERKAGRAGVLRQSIMTNTMEGRLGLALEPTDTLARGQVKVGEQAGGSVFTPGMKEVQARRYFRGVDRAYAGESVAWGDFDSDGSVDLFAGQTHGTQGLVLGDQPVLGYKLEKQKERLVALDEESEKLSLHDESRRLSERTMAPTPTPEVQTADQPYSTFSLNISDVSFRLCAASLEKGVMPDPSTIRSEEFINAFDYRDPEPPPGVPVSLTWEMARYPYAHNREVLRLSLKTAASGRNAHQPLNLVLLLDNSGSMERADRVRIIEECLRVLAAQLRPEDKISVVAFARTARLWADGLSGEEAQEALRRVTELTPQGGTNLEDALDQAYATAIRHFLPQGINRVILLTDGAANLGDVTPASLKQRVEHHRQQGIALDCFGIGWEGYHDELLEALSRNGDGRYGFVNSPDEAAVGFANRISGALQTAAADVKVQVQFNPQRVQLYRQIGYAKHQLTQEQFRDAAVDAAEIAASESGTALYVLGLNPQGQGPLGWVRVRYKLPATGEYQEHEWLLSDIMSPKSFEQASSALRLATVAAAFSEWLASSPFAADVNPELLVRHLQGIPEIYPLDHRPRQLELMIQQAKSVHQNR
ncbi:MAG TPA: von Willebrand factor type A domain-containing protein [Candidatus Paceibacterota bacterium]|nr:von Willebrand factor type A domain-containing protein [Verrucomicrobiota bacterium]HRY50145.1 von Willebrand factor type A domain-containing protein [Candidatus Paceibacterota bacterium]